MKCLACLRQSDCVSIERTVNILTLMMLQVLLALSILDFRFSMFGFEDRLIIWSMPFLLLVSHSLFFWAGLSCKHPSRHILWNISIPIIFNTCQYTRAEAVPSDAKQSRRQLTGHSDYIRPRDPQQTHCSTDFRWRVKNIEKSDPRWSCRAKAELYKHVCQSCQVLPEKHFFNSWVKDLSVTLDKQVKKWRVLLIRQTTPEKLLSLNELVCESIRFQGWAAELS